ncbi:MAG: Bax inhibitor-1 family protein [Clostridiales bacterium]|nr:Bax inhibitor-1 family protein [Clostridiales bacterium]
MDALHLDRTQTARSRELDESTYNLIIGGLLLYGLAANALICYCFSDLSDYLSGGFAALFLVLYIVCVFLSVALSASPSPAVNFIGYNLLVLPIGLLLSVTVSAVSFRTVQSAVVGTGVFVVLMAASWARPDFFLSLGRTLWVALAATLVAEIVLYFLGFGGGLLDYLFVAIFSLYLGFDWARACACAPTARNAILSATQIYLDIINIFVRLLSIFSRRKN